MSKLLITGHPGWLSTALLDELGRRPLPGITGVRALVHPGEPEPRAQAFLGKPIELHRASLTDPEGLRGIAEGCSHVLHAAGVIHVRRTRDWYETNVRGTEQLLAEARRAGSVRRLVYISSNAACGRSPSPEILMTEAEEPHPLSHYGRSKRLAEQAVLSGQNAFEAVVLRPCMFYGQPIPARHVKIYRRIQASRMPIVGDGSYTRSLTHVTNLVQACGLALLHPKAAGNTYFIADRRPYTLREIIEAMADALGTHARYLRLPRLASRLAYRIDSAAASLGAYWQDMHLLGEADWNVGVSIEKAVRELGYDPRVELREGMREAIAWCRRQGLL